MRYISILIALIVVFTGSGCSKIKRLKNDIIKQKTMVTIHGTVMSLRDDNKAPIMVVLMKDKGAYPELVDYKIKNREGSFTFTTRPGKYKIYAWQDLNANKRFDADEPIDTAVVWAYLYGMTKNIHLKIKERASDELLQEIHYVRKKQVVNLNKSRMLLGSVISLDNECFSDTNVSNGMIEPYAFLESVPNGLFFLQKYNPHKKIVLFVHGINGSPRNFRDIIDTLDTTEYQALIYYYPSGLKLNMVSESLEANMEELRVKLGFKKISLIAHSMGGLVSRDFLNRLTKRGMNYVDTFITISTPWDGHESAGYGVKYSPIILPVWSDMAPHSEFLNTLFTTKLPDTTPFYLLFGYSGISVTAGGNSDGVVSIKSQLRYEAQEESKVMRGFDEEHMSILKNQRVLMLIQELLAKAKK